jgi:hypothetical protein
MNMDKLEVIFIDATDLVQPDKPFFKKSELKGVVVDELDPPRLPRVIFTNGAPSQDPTMKLFRELCRPSITRPVIFTYNPR